MKASIQRFDANGGNQTTFASGLRNATSLAFHPDTGDLYTVVQERDGLGDNLAPDYLITRAAGRLLRLALLLHRPAPAAGLCAIAAR